MGDIRLVGISVVGLGQILAEVVEFTGKPICAVIPLLFEPGRFVILVS